MEDNCLNYEQIKQIHEWQKASRYVDGFCHGFILCFILFALLGTCIYFMK